MKPSSYFLIFLLILMAGLIGISLTFDTFESRFLPLIIGSFVFLLALLELRKELVTAKKIEAKTETDQPGVKKAQLGTALGWLVGFPLGAYLVGFQIFIPLSLLFYLKLRNRSWGAAIAVSLITTIVVYGIFLYGLKVELWRGLVFQ